MPGALMGFLDKIFGAPRSNIEKHLEDLFYEKNKIFGVSRKQIRDAIQQCKREAEIAGDSEFGENFGEDLLNRANNGDEDAITAVENRIKGGANEDDIKSWWKKHYLERRMIKWEDDLTRVTTFKALIMEKGLSEDEALKEMRKSFPIYGDPTDESSATGEDRPIPYELHDRIEILTVQLTPIYIQQYSKEHGSMNAFFRHELRIDEQEDNE